MAISDNQKIDLLWKKVGFGKAKSDSASAKKAPNEAIVSKFIIAPDYIWADASFIPATKPAANVTAVVVYNGQAAVSDGTSEALRTWKSNIVNWIPPTFGATYQLKVYIDSASSANAVANGTQVFETGSGNNDEWYFDYQSGLLHFIGINLPSSLVSGESVYLSGAKYNGNTGLSGSGSFDPSNAGDVTSANIINGTITSLTAPLNVSDGGTNVSSFTSNSVLVSANSTTLGFQTGSNNQFLTISDNDVTFSDIDGGTY
jgi:hypothetical protein|tara:strand:- start:8770 stop:9546 length:777 start_codon:yes stop_codon:yes gene_type:complete